jgi:3-oxoacyl-[acyl-carrier-protein] synthase II
LRKNVDILPLFFDLLDDKMRRVVVTGLGLVTPLGCSVSTVWTRLLEGVVGITALTGPDYATIPCKVAASVPRGSQPNEFNIDDAAPKSDRKYLSNSMLFALHAADQAVRDADLTNLTKEDLERTGVCLGMGMVRLPFFLIKN